MDDEGRCCGVIAINLDDGTIHQFHAQMTILTDRRYGRVCIILVPALIPRPATAMTCCAPGCQSRTWSSSIHPTGIYGAGCLITEGSRRQGAAVVNGEGEPLRRRYAPSTGTSLRATWYRGR
ncbi:MAG: FAD-binding protein [Xanthobacteraceae bacterium]